MHFAGIDLASSHVGVSILNEKGDLDHLSRKATAAANFKSKWDRYAVVVGHVMNEILPRKPTLRRIAIEGYGGNFKNSLIPGVECGTILRIALIKADLMDLVVEVPPLSLKKFVTGNGTAGKEMIIAYIFKNYGLMPPDNDQADAYGLAQLARKSTWGESQRKDLFAYEKEVLKKLGL